MTKTSLIGVPAPRIARWALDAIKHLNPTGMVKQAIFADVHDMVTGAKTKQSRYILTGRPLAIAINDNEIVIRQGNKPLAQIEFKAA